MTGITYRPIYDSPALRGSEEPRPWNVVEVLRRFWKPGGVVLDVGCGTCVKTAWMARESAEFVAVDPSSLMREAARERLSETRGHFCVLDGTCQAIPLDSGTVDFLACIMVPHDTRELMRVLSKGAMCVLEVLGEMDKRTLKERFPEDAAGRRGQLMDVGYPDRRTSIQAELSEYADIVLSAEGRWNSSFSRPQLEALLTHTNTVRGFSPEADRKVLDQFEALHGAPAGIPLLNHRYLFVARRR